VNDGLAGQGLSPVFMWSVETVFGVVSLTMSSGIEVVISVVMPADWGLETELQMPKIAARMAAVSRRRCAMMFAMSSRPGSVAGQTVA
jgi:hypothetical protein